MKKINTIWNEQIENLDEWVDEDGNPMSYEEAEELNYMYLEDERMNLDIQTDGKIICIGDIGLWNGRRRGYKILNNNVSDILRGFMNGCSSCHWFSDGKDVRGTESHHDGNNSYIYRILKGDSEEEQEENAEKLFSGKLTAQRIGIFTKSIVPLVNAVYGW